MPKVMLLVATIGVKLLMLSWRLFLVQRAVRRDVIKDLSGWLFPERLEAFLFVF